jgi:protease IV
MIRLLWLVLTAPVWLPWRLLGWLIGRWSARPTLHLVLSGALPDLAPHGGVFGFLRRRSGPDLIGVLTALEAAALDPKLATLLVRIEELSCGLGRAEELRAALERVRSAGKQVIVHADELGLSGYWIALAASSIRLSPTGNLNVSGVAMEFTLLKGLLDRVGVRAQLLARGAYKSMRETFAEEKMSEANREMLTSLVEDLSSQLIARVASSRGDSLELARSKLDLGPFRAEEAKERSLIDGTQYWDEAWHEVGGDSSKVQSLDSYRKRQRRRQLLPRRGTQIGLLRITGNIRSGHDRQGPGGTRATGSQSLRRALRQLTKSPRVRAIVLRVDSPGGSALASDLMWHELNVAAEKKPIFVSMVNMAASGGYYTSALKGVSIWANPTTLTGSIGVVGGKLETSALLAKLGVARETVASGPRANFYSVTTPWNEDELAKLDRDMDALYSDFVSKMAIGRGLSYEALHAVAQGRVWTGQQARGVSLVDHLGGLHDVKIAIRERLGLKPDLPLEWAVPSQPRGLRALRESEAENLARLAEPLFRSVPELAESLGRAIDLPGDRFLALSLIQARTVDG